MKLTITTCLLVGLLAFSAPASSATFILEGHIKGAKDMEVVYLNYTSLKNNEWHDITDSAKVINGAFSFKGDITELSLAWIDINGYAIPIYIEPTSMRLQMDKDKPYAYELEGTAVEKENRTLRKELESYEQNRYEKVKKILRIIEQIQVPADKSVQDSLRKIIYQGRDELTRISEELAQANFLFAATHSSYRIAPALLSTLAQHASIGIDSIRQVYNSLPEQSKSSLLGRLARKQIEEQEKKQENIKRVQVGCIAPDFTREDAVSGATVTLSQFRNKSYVLLDFWASWCAPCLKEIPKLKQLHSTYSEKGLALVSISLDEDKASWLRAVSKHELNAWAQILGVQNDEDLSSIYNVEEIPSFILIDKQGKIVARWEFLQKEQLAELARILEAQP